MNMRDPYNPYPDRNRVTLALGRDLTDDEWQQLWSARISCMFFSEREQEEERKMKEEFANIGLEPLSLVEIANCVRDALRRFAIFINPIIGNKNLTLNTTDKSLAESRKNAPLNKRDHKLFALDFLSVDPSRSEHEEASRCFYNALRLIQGENSFEKVDFELTRPFLAYLYIGQKTPNQKLINGLDTSNKRDVLRESNVVYVVRNLFHNFVHIGEGINDSNYHDFAGEHREHSDFEADNGSWILLLKSYGLTPMTNGVIPDFDKKKIDRLFNLVSSNRIFVLRSEFRDCEDEKVWRMRRSIANKISQGLIMKGRTPVSVKVFINDVVSHPNNELQFNSVSASVNDFNFPQLNTNGLSSHSREEKISFISQHFVSSAMSRISDNQHYAECFGSFLESKLQLFRISVR